MMFRALVIFFLIPGVLLARSRFIPANETAAQKLNQPWFTGPLLASSSTTIPVGHWNIEPYFFATKTPAQYNQDWVAKKVPTFWSLNTVVPLWIGLTNWMDIEIQPQWSWNHKSNVGGQWEFGDLNVQLEFQLYRPDFPAKNWIPAIKIAVRESCPTGRYQRLDPIRGAIEQGGGGAWATSFIFVLGRLFHLSGVHYLSGRINGMYTIFAPVHVRGFNAYGGGFGTDGMAYPKPSFLLDVAFEISLTRNWSFALDLVGRWRGRNGGAASNTSPASIQYSIAPGIEYNFNANLGIIAGPWITFAGKNSNEFYSAVIALNYYQ
jgi:hypothetical protein